MVNYVLILIADVLFASQFLFTKLYQNRTQDPLTASLKFSMGSMAVICVMMLCLSGFSIAVTGFSLLMAGAMACVCLLLTYFSIASLAHVNLSLYSVFMMLGGMLLPFVYGILFLGEPLTVAKAVCVLLIIGAMALSVERSAAKKSAVKYYIGVFVVNGLSSVVSKIHQIHPEKNVPTANFLFLTYVLVIVASALIIFLRAGNAGFEPMIRRTYWRCFAGYGISAGTAELLSMTAMISLPASIQFSMVSGGVIVFSTIISLIRGEKQSQRTFLSVTLALAALIVVGL